LITEGKFWPLLERSVRCADYLVKQSGFDTPTRPKNNLGIGIIFGWSLFCLYGKQCGVKKSPLINEGSAGKALLHTLQQILPGGKDIDSLDRLLQLVAVMVANRRLLHGIHFTQKVDGDVVLSLQDVLPEVRKYVRETDTKESILSEHAYRELIKTRAEAEDSYVVSPSDVGMFHSRQQRRGVLLDLYVMADELGIDTDIWEKPPDVEKGNKEHQETQASPTTQQ